MSLTIPAETRSQANALVEYFRCPGYLAEIQPDGELSSDEGYFTFGGMICYGRLAGKQPSRFVGGTLPDVSDAVAREGGSGLHLPFDMSEVVTNLRHECYRRGPIPYLERITTATAVRHIYYFLRPLLQVAVRKHLQRIRFTGWDRIVFPNWPVDLTVETLMKHTMGLILKNLKLERMPFIWFWPEGAPGCVLVTHDAEGPAGLEFCDQLMDLDDSFGIKSAFQLIPEGRGVTSKLWENIRSREFEVNLHDLNHDCYLFQSKPRFLERAADINRYARDLQCGGFRSAAMYRNQRWFGAFEFSYDMSVPTVAHFEPQGGGCCTVMPFFIGDILELPLTTTQDYSLFHILGDYTTALWKQQTDLILASNGLVSFITHPDYLIEKRAQAVYRELLAHLCQLRNHRKVWVTLPGEVDRWWRARAAMTLVPHGDSWRIEGPDSDRARVAYATLEGDRVVFGLEEGSATGVTKLALA
jgi:hypothetical protein